MDTKVPYMPSIGDLPKILDAMQNAAVPDIFTLDFLVDLGFKDSNDRAIPRVLKYLGFLDPSSHPTDAYRQFMDQTKSKVVLATRMRTAFDDLFASDQNADAKSATELRGWFKQKTGASNAVAEKMASQFRALAQYADFDTSTPVPVLDGPPPPVSVPKTPEPTAQSTTPATHLGEGSALSLVYRLEIHLPDTQNLDTYRAIFRAMREELAG